MRAKTQMRIGLWGAVFITGLGIHHFFSELPYLSYPDFLICVAFPMLLFVIYIFSILSKNLKMSKIIYRIWLYVAIIILFLNALFDILTLMGMFSIPLEWADVIGFLILVVVYGFITLILRTGLKGLKQIIEVDNKSMIENTSQTEEKAGDK